ncbi:MAG: adenylosuccinate lyase [Bacteriovoracaceae bacterium]
MIPRYECKEISSLWTEEKKFEYFLKVELKLLQVLESKREYRIPQGLSQTIQSQASIKLDRIHEIEKEVHHDVIAFCTSITEQVPKEIGKYFHFGVTSSDIIDTALSLQMKDSLVLILAEFKKMLSTFKTLIEHSEFILCIGRSHGQHAEAMLLAQKWLSFYAELDRRYQELNQFVHNEITGQLSGAVGNYTIISPEIEQEVIVGLGLKLEPVSSQIIPRDRLLKLVSIGAMIATSIERLAVEIRHLSRTEVGEVSERFNKMQKGSSTMPHKRNPIATENLTGIARVIRSHLTIAHENSVTWHERDISHSSAERLYLPDHLGLLFYALQRMEKVVGALNTHEEVMKERVMTSVTSISSFYLHELIIKSKLTREEIYAIIQEVSFMDLKTASEFKEKIEEKTGLSLPEFSYEEMLVHYRHHYFKIKKRVLKP